MSIEQFEQLISLLSTRFDKIDKTLDCMMRVKSSMDGDQLLDNQDLCLLLGVTKRTLARYRQKKIITYYQVDGKTYYKASEVQDFFKRRGK